MSYHAALSLTQPPPLTIAEEPDSEPTVLLRRIVLSFFATVFVGVLLCVTYLSQRARVAPHPETVSAPVKPALRAMTQGAWLVLDLPSPPPPLPDSASPYAAEADAVAAPVVSGSPLKLELSATEDAWVEVQTDGRVTFAKLIRADQTVSFEAVSSIRMVTGNALGLALRFNGEPVRLTSARRVRTIEFTSDGPREPEPTPRDAKS